VQSVRKVNEGPRAGFLVVDENAEEGLFGAEAEVSLMIFKVFDIG
jgi:hypothetical protein